MAKLLEGKTALITGATRGIGKAIALEFAKNGANIAFTGLNYNENAKNTEAQILALGVKAKMYPSDASNFLEAENVVNQIIADFEAIDILVNNAGITKDNALKRLSEEDFDAVIKVNLKSLFNFSKFVQPVMWRQGSGSIINISSVVGIHGNAMQCNYAASKAGMIGFTMSIAKEVGSRNIRCNVVAPGFIVTEMTQDLPEQLRQMWRDSIPLKRLGTPEDVAKVCLFLASELSEYVTGQVIPVCGGLSI
ncbi:beta-ketoacyl-ACP reductase [Bacteroidia bacterium]|nr:beta-ketoacyl-ACP reductase [Bacteroidia bacterium]GHV45113.1 beta-ketoacyl-ACP reductase [Bacteroidia bacterium]